MSKQDPEAAPPPYSESAFPTTSTIPSRPTAQTPSPSSLLNSHLATHLSSLPARLRQTQSERATRQALCDLDVVERIVPHVEAFVADVVDAHPRPTAELTIVPAPAVPPAWALSGAAERRREGELVHLVRLAVPDTSPPAWAGASDDKGPPPPPAGNDKAGRLGDAEAASRSAGSSLRPERDWTSTQFDEWGRWDEDAEAAAAGGTAGSGSTTSWWWRDERMAERLAAHLRPRPPVKMERREVRAAVVQAKEDKKSGWGLWRKKSSSSTAAPASSAAAAAAAAAPAVSPESPVLDHDDGVKMTVRADEVTFRRENDFGVWESMSGWGIVVTIAVR
ncbi:hypothetical protein PpBr36_08312 [Pyricularia pennisetigena]|uniref:hypothetical protein n=1 Tax=Pyricularia pennisetigena TaxID=1578925 RepID=UPI00114DF694|nr:hypothetical protein PpBr36_08312 [Pyricularia pennisetigena]TLS24644.1 hypothetical protein PpBr36_08312 [Pyricularia pennisetigena]